VPRQKIRPDAPAVKMSDGRFLSGGMRFAFGTKTEMQWLVQCKSIVRLLLKQDIVPPIAQSGHLVAP
jgi:hypothetical protein